MIGSSLSVDQLSGENSAFAAHLPAVLSAPVMKAIRHNARASHASRGILFSRAFDAVESRSVITAPRITRNATMTQPMAAARAPQADTAPPRKTTIPATPMAKAPAPNRSIRPRAQSAPAKKIAPNSAHVPATTRAFAPNPLWARYKALDTEKGVPTPTYE